MSAFRQQAVDWFAEIRAARLEGVARAFGLDQSASGNSLGPCPCCGAEQRSRHDRRRPIGLVHRRDGWACFCCSAKGDAVALAAAIVTGEVAPSRDRWRDVREACAARGLCTPEDTGAIRAPFVPRVPVRPPPAPSRPPSYEVREAWAQAVPVTDDPRVATYLESRGLDPARIADAGLARALPITFQPFTWMRCAGQTWPEVYPLLVPMHAADGGIKTLHARAVDAAVTPKGASPAGYEIAGTVMADGLALGLLRGTCWPTGESVADLVRASVGLVETGDGAARFGAVVCEGVTDFFTAASTWSETYVEAPAVFGILAGSWTSAIADRIPDGTRVLVVTDPDEAGDRYAQAVNVSLRDRCEVVRGCLPGGA